MTGEMEGEPQEDTIDSCVQRLLQGESLDHVLRSYPDRQPQLRAALEPVAALLQSTLPEPSSRAQHAAMDAMLRQVRDEAERPQLPRAFRWLGSLRARPLAFQALAAVAAIVLFGAVGLGASAATGAAPEPVRDFLGISSSSATLRVTGSVVSIQSNMLVLRTANGDHPLEIDAATAITRGNEQIGVTGLLVGETVVATASHARDGSLIARDVRAAAPPPPTSTAAIGAPALPEAGDDATGTPSERSAGGDDHSGAGSTATPGPGDHHGDDGQAATPPSGATPTSSESPGTRTPDHEDATPQPGQQDATGTPSGAAATATPGGGDSEGHDGIILLSATDR